MRRERDHASGSIASSRSAATGGTLLDRIAGRSADAAVTSKPTHSVVTTVLPRRLTPVDGRSTPAALSRLRRPTARPTPETSPIREPTRPITNASTSSAKVTCLRLAPTARSSAFSRRRCATVIENRL
uniref:Unannotated protein n=1 Tax=freshwater metagenome TaxID=449393 RepID=A0A6J7NAZ0_9ZZZZ